MTSTPAFSASEISAKQRKTAFIASTFGAVGVVYGDIGTSPLYALRECFTGAHSVPLTPANIYGVLSLIVWSLVLVVTVKYLTFIMRADNRGEGGILALMALALKGTDTTRHRMGPILVLGLFGAALLYGDGMITPAISVLSAVEGLRFITPWFSPYVTPITLAILFTLFAFQKHGTARIGMIFGPLMTLWFLTLGVLGVHSVFMQPEVFKAVNPYYAFNFFQNNTWQGFVVLGGVFLVATGAEALYADMGHFGRKPIQFGWFFLVFPSLVMHYFGQGALLLRDPTAIENPFYRLAPPWALVPLVMLSTCATVIASQALLTGAFSLSQQAVQLGFMPRLSIKHTSGAERGQIYVPSVNWALFIGAAGLVLAFKSSSNLAAAYGIAVTGTMLITTMLAAVVARRAWHWNLTSTVLMMAVLISIDLAFFGANALKIPNGGWVPLLLGVILFFLMVTWKRGRTILADRLLATSPAIDKFLCDVVPQVTRVPGTAVFLTGLSSGTPHALVQNAKHNKVLHENAVLLTLVTAEVPYIAPAERLKTEALGQNVFRIVATFGFMDEPNVPAALFREQGIRFVKADGIEHNLNFYLESTTFFLGQETLIASKVPGMALWREKIFAFLSRNSQRASSYFHIPSDRVIQLGIVIDL